MISTIYQNNYAKFNKYFLMFTPITIIFQSCLGSTAAMMALNNIKNPTALPELALTIFTCIRYNSLILAQFNTKFIYNALIVSVVINSLLILINL